MGEERYPGLSAQYLRLFRALLDTVWLAYSRVHKNGILWKSIVGTFFLHEHFLAAVFHCRGIIVDPDLVAADCISAVYTKQLSSENLTCGLNFPIGSKKALPCKKLSLRKASSERQKRDPKPSE